MVVKYNLSYEKQYLAKMVGATEYDEDGWHVEIGSKDGHSIYAAAQAHPSVRIYSVDPAHTAIFKKTFGKDPRVKAIKGTSKVGYKKIKADGSKIQSVFIDGGHTKPWVKYDIGHFSRLWDGSGFFCGHDFARDKKKNWGIIPAVCEYYGIENYKKIKRMWEVKDGILFVAGTFWCYFRNEQMSVYGSVIQELM